MASDLKQEYLDLKYSYVDGEADAKPKKKTKKKAPKKADHKHEYQNIVIEYVYDKNYPVQRLAGKPAYALESYCPICGKLNSAIQDPVAIKLFPNIYTGHFGFIAHIAGHEQECNDYEQSIIRTIRCPIIGKVLSEAVRPSSTLTKSYRLRYNI